MNHNFDFFKKAFEERARKTIDYNGREFDKVHCAIEDVAVIDLGVDYQVDVIAILRHSKMDHHKMAFVVQLKNGNYRPIALDSKWHQTFSDCGFAGSRVYKTFKGAMEESLNFIFY